ncbi:transcriptional regulator [Pseudomonas sp. CK-NBRI-02]|uniref:XRE family transcriptional regulator n=1 Tax=Pseudomonas sp. CK-NBRI-02 TaxID=2249759 RepID=UPI0005BDBFDC|nr:S24 family peptidase [Pseudomonas sp. CK-NBRI-02]TYO76375.1 transcriptional regulator [Pseudomonas sp. CK-NBRI-02]
MNTSGDRLRVLLQECHLTPSDFAILRGVTPQHVNNWFRRGVPLARLDDIAELFCVHRRWLRTGEGPKHVNPLANPYPSHLNMAQPANQEGTYIRLPIHLLRNGTLQPDEGKYLSFSEQMLQMLGVAPEDAACIPMPMTGIASIIPTDATLVIDRSLTWVVDGETYVLMHNGRLRVHRLSRDRLDNLYLHGHEPTERYTPRQRQAQGMQILGWVFHWSCFSLRRPC